MQRSPDAKVTYYINGDGNWAVSIIKLSYRAHEDYGYCQAGTSGALFDDDTMVLGTPGPYTWRGTVYVTSFEPDYLKRDKMHYYGPHTELTSPVDKYSYLGMHPRAFLNRFNEF